MSSLTPYRTEKNGIYYTPTPLARMLADQIIQRSDIAILDPACGNGALLWAAASKCRQLNDGLRDRPSLYGCDKFNPVALSREGRRINFTKTNFFKYTPKRKFDLILMNPPFLASGRMAKTTRSSLHTRFGRICDIPSTADIWAYFLIKSAGHLAKGGAIGAILPWPFLQAEYACNLRKWVSQHFGLVKTLVLSGDHFTHTTKRVLLLWLQKYGQKAESVRIGFSHATNQKHTFRHMSINKWASRGPILSDGNGVDEILAAFAASHGFCEFEDIADVRIGIVTGADGFFILPADKARSNGFHQKNLIPILTSGRNLSGLAMKDSQAAKLLLKLPRSPSRRYAKYIREGKKAGFDQRSHSKRRDPWYAVALGETPDAFFHYRVSRVPFLVRNEGKLQCTNSVHRVYFNGLTKNEQKWIQVSLLAVPGQLSLETSSKTYGNGVLKVEPSSLKRALVYRSKEKIPKDSYAAIAGLIAQRKKQEAAMVATKLIARVAKIPPRLIKRSTEALRDLQSRRLS